MFNSNPNNPRVQELWKSDGTPEGTRQVSGGGTGPYPFTRYDLTSAGKVLFFMVYQRTSIDGSNTQELWRSDGTPEGTVPVRDPLSGKP